MQNVFRTNNKVLYLVPNRLVLKPKKTERINLPKLAAFTGSNLFSEQ